jgi:hypothetical protein
MRILTAGYAPGVQQSGGNLREFLKFVAVRRWGIDAAARFSDWRPVGSPIIARIVGSKWAVMCDVCKDAYPSDPDDPGETFICPNCLNAREGGLARPVLFPSQRKTIEAILLLRANPADRNWTDETVQELIEENKRHGDPVPEE